MNEKSYICFNCGKKFTDPKHKSVKRKYCCHKCYTDHKKYITTLKSYRICPNCGIWFQRKKRRQIYCSNNCKHKVQMGVPKTKECISKIKTVLKEKGITHPGSTYVNKEGFVIITGTNKKLHTKIAENILGRPLKFNEVVHHIDENRQNNENSNLVICERSLHPTIHAKMRVKQMEE